MQKVLFTNLLSTFEEWTSAWDQGFGIDAIFLDYSKAFNSVPHQRLIVKLEALGVHGNLSLWLSNFLSNHFQRVVLNGHMSSVVSGVPQGSILSLLLFILYVNDILVLIETNIRMFADNKNFPLFKASMIILSCRMTLIDCCDGLTYGYFVLNVS